MIHLKGSHKTGTIRDNCSSMFAFGLPLTCLLWVSILGSQTRWEAVDLVRSLPTLLVPPLNLLCDLETTTFFSEAEFPYM